MREDRCPQLSVPIDRELKARLEAAAAARDRLIADLEKSVAAREARLLNELGEAQLVAREKAAEAKLTEAKALMADYNNDKHAAAIYLRQCSERDAAEQSAA
jgi:hypothetical protein